MAALTKRNLRRSLSKRRFTEHALRFHHRFSEFLKRSLFRASQTENGGQSTRPLASLLAHRAFRRHVLSHTDRGVTEESRKTTLIKRATARSTARFLASETNMLGEREPQKKCALHLFVFEHIRGSPGVRKKLCPVTPCVPARMD